jgi:hypothetical protein
VDRRDFLRIAGWAGLTCVLPSVLDASKGRAQSIASSAYTGTYWIFMHAGGGWDPTHLCDPKGRTSENEPDPMGRFLRDDIRTAGNIRYAPLGDDQTALDAFFQANYQRLLVINGMDTGTNGHDQGTRGTWSGRTAEGHPPIGALIAATYGPNLPMPLIGYGGYLDTQGVTNAVPLGDGGLLHNLAFPARPNPTESEENYFGEVDVPGIVQREQQLRLLRLQGKQRLPRIWDGQNELMLARLGQDDLKRVSESLPTEFSDNAIERQIQVALAAYQAGLSVSVSVSMGGFDTHGNHDANHLPRLIDFVNGANFAMQEAERKGMADKIAIVMGSDFGRTPGYNSGNGKDHWPISSMMMMGPGIPGNTVIGGTDDRHGLFLVDPATLQPTGYPDSAEGTRLSIAHVHRALRNLAGIPDEYKAAFPLAGEDLPIFG